MQPSPTAETVKGPSWRVAMNVSNSTPSSSDLFRRPMNIARARCSWVPGTSPGMTDRTGARKARLSSVEALLDRIERPHRVQRLVHAGVRLAALADGGEELAVLQLDAVHRHVDMRDVDLVVLAVEQVVVAG